MSTTPDPLITNNPGTAIPLWLRELMPPFLRTRPAATEAIYTFIMALHKYSYPIFGALYGVALTQNYPNVIGDHSFFVWLWNNGNGLILGYVFGGGAAGIQATIAHNKAKAAVDDTAGAAP